MQVKCPGPDADRAWHGVPSANLPGRLRSTLHGLTRQEAARRLTLHGANLLPAPREPSLLRLLLRQFRSPLAYLLLIAAALSVGLRQVSEAGFILLVLLINAAIGAAQEWQATRRRAALRGALAPHSRVRRDGEEQQVASAALVPGDLVLLEAGERVPADLRLLHATELQADEAAMTGESLPVDKMAGEALPPDTPLADRHTMLHAGTTVQRGRAEGLVVATGAGTELGHIAEALRQPAPDPPLTRRLEQFTRRLGFGSLALVGLVVVQQALAGAPLRETLLIAVALAVAVIPEGLPIAVTVALSVATRRMAARHVIVTSLAAVEGLGACTVIATDKTGTLTVNRLTAGSAWLPEDGTVEIGGGQEPEDAATRADAPLPPRARDALLRLARSAVLCNDGALEQDGATLRGHGDTVDVALLIMARKVGIEVEALRRTAPRASELPFSAERKYAATVNRQDDAVLLHVKGAPEVVLPLCRDVAGAVEATEHMAARGERVLAIATRRVPPGEKVGPGMVSALELLGLVGFSDPLRPEARDAVAACRAAGVRVVMITGDHASTALAIAAALGIADQPGQVVTGRQLAAAGGSGAAAALVRDAQVFARVEPAQKVRVVEALRAAGEVVAMTGDGINDAPALRCADLGIAMGRGGTDVARDAADLVLTDDNMASVVAGIEEGRAAYANIRKVLLLLISTGLAEAVLFLLALGCGLPAPLTAVQLLWLNLVTNGGQDVAMGFERPEPGLLRRPPRAAGAPLMDRSMLRQIAVSGLLMGGVSCGVFAWLLARGWDDMAARNIVLLLLVTFENVQVFNCRSESVSAFRVPLRNNLPLLAMVAAAQTLHLGAMLSPGLGEVLQLQPVSPLTWLALLPVAASVLVVAEADKWLRARHRPAPPALAG